MCEHTDLCADSKPQPNIVIVGFMRLFLNQTVRITTLSEVDHNIKWQDRFSVLMVFFFFFREKL